ncbi:hypothetical protein JEQ12_004093 [Ovis aries]|uniref:Uncharacterized protein n=1 Tax=Ovis aries TaxID=9940 RepID=A0A836CW97_SHEEP|nr:hypothetical protein JEQ12_004093 [Ovis aries]
MASGCSGYALLGISLYLNRHLCLSSMEHGTCSVSSISGFPNEPAAVIALSTIKEWLAKNQHETPPPQAITLFCRGNNSMLQPLVYLCRPSMGTWLDLGIIDMEEPQVYIFKISWFSSV